MPTPDEVAALFAPYPRPHDTLIAATRRKVSDEGGYADPIDSPHRGYPLDYSDDPEELTALRDPDEARKMLKGDTCACGRRGAAVGIAYQAEDGQPDTLRACVHCDGLHRTPRFRPSLR